jgi:hypothetical protein
MNKVPKGCDQQGRFPEAAEAATEVGQEEEPNFYGKDYVLEELGALALWAVGIVVVVGTIALLVGRYV